MTLITSQAHLKTLLDTITGDGQAISVTYDYPNPSPASFPAAYLILTNSEEEAITTAQDYLFSTFIVRLAVQAKWTSAGYQKALSMIDTVLAVLRQESSRTSGTIINLLVAPDIKVNYVDSAQGKMIFADISVTVQDLITTG